jgi:hypothetical protein
MCVARGFGRGFKTREEHVKRLILRVLEWPPVSHQCETGSFEGVKLGGPEEPKKQGQKSQATGRFDAPDDECGCLTGMGLVVVANRSLLSPTSLRLTSTLALALLRAAPIHQLLDNNDDDDDGDDGDEGLISSRPSALSWKDLRSVAAALRGMSPRQWTWECTSHH